MQLLRQGGFTEMNAGGVALIMADVMIAYRGESFYGDVLSVAIYAEEITEYSFDLLYRITTLREDRQVEIAHAKTGMVCFDYSSRKVIPMTPGLRSFLQR
jgi:acyl-CoA thioesterase FadM